MSSEPPSSPLRVRPISAEDEARFRTLWQAYLDFYHEALPAEVTALTWRRLLDPMDQPYGLVAVDARDEVLGFAIYHFHLSTWSPGGYCYLEDLYVDETARRCGVGRALIEAVYRAAAERGATRVYWQTDDENKIAQALYERVAERSPFIQYRWRVPKA